MTFTTPVPEGDYLELLGRPASTWSDAEWTMRYPIQWLTGEDLAGHVGGSGGTIISTLVRALGAEPPQFVTGASWEQAGEGAQGLATANARRNDILHARPASTARGLQRLNRWAPDNPRATAGFIESDDLAAFARLVEASALSSVHCSRSSAESARDADRDAEFRNTGALSLRVTRGSR